MFSSFAGREEKEKIKRIKIDLRVREEELKRLKGKGSRETIASLEADVCRLKQSLNMFSGPCCQVKNQNFFV